MSGELKLRAAGLIEMAKLTGREKEREDGSEILRPQLNLKH